VCTFVYVCVGVCVHQLPRTPVLYVYFIVVSPSFANTILTITSSDDDVDINTYLLSYASRRGGACEHVSS